MEEGDGGTGAQIKKSARRQSSHSFSAANEDSLGQDVSGGTISKETLLGWVTERELQWCEANLRAGCNHQYWIKESRPNNCWPEPEPNLNLTVAERGLWYDGDTVGFRTLEELVEKRKASVSQLMRSWLVRFLLHAESPMKSYSLWLDLSQILLMLVGMMII